MSEGQGEAVELPPQADAAFSSLMDLLVSSESDASAGTGGEAAAAAAGGGAPADGAGDPAGAGAAAAGGAGALPVAGEGTLGAPADAGATGAPAAAGGGAAAADAGTGAAADAVGGGAAGLPAGWTIDSKDVLPQLAELNTKLEENVSKQYQEAALEAARGDFEKYFEAIEKHPRMLVGADVPALGKDGTERISSTEDAREWQEAVKGLLVEEIRDRAGRAMEENSGALNTLTASIELFQKNTDLLPGTKGFDKELATRFTQMVTPYETRVEGKLQGYAIPVQPIIDQLRSQIQAERAKIPAATAAPAPSGPAPAKVNRPPADAPQAGITSKAGGSGKEAEDFSTLFGTIGLPNLQI